MDKDKLLVFGVVLVLVIAATYFQDDTEITGNVAGMTLGPLKSYGSTTSQSLSFKSSATQKLCQGSLAIKAAAEITDMANRYQGGVQGMIEDALGIPSYELPDIYGLLAKITAYMRDDESKKCLEDIGEAMCDKYCGNCRAWSGTVYTSVTEGAGSWYYTDWIYYYMTVKYQGSGKSCNADVGCVFSYNPDTKKTGSCW